MLKAQLRAYVETLADDEPGFLLRAQDQLAPDTVGDWMQRCEMMNVTNTNVPEAKIDGAERCQSEMRKWQDENPDSVKLPD
jgi:hypothetical protein